MAPKIQLTKQKEYCGSWDDDILALVLERKQRLVERMEEQLKDRKQEIFYIKWEQREREAKKICAPEVAQ